MDGITLITGNANKPLAGGIARHLGVPLASVTVTTFQDGEIRVNVDDNLQGRDVFVIQSISSPVNRNLMELLLLVDAARRGAARRVTAVVPYLAYARQDRRASRGQPISAKVVANLLEAAGAERLVTLDLHASAIEGFFDIPVAHLTAGDLLAAHCGTLADGPDVVAAPDEGAVERAVHFREALGEGVDLAVMIKQRPEPDKSQVVGLVGQGLVEGRRVALVDDIISTGGTVIEAADYLLRCGATAVSAVAVHPVLAREAGTRLENSALSRVIVTDSVPVEAAHRFPKLTVLTVAPLLAEAIGGIHQERI
jgi:ribose-phosphate pyrophosphokinase